MRLSFGFRFYNSCRAVQLSDLTAHFLYFGVSFTHRLHYSDTENHNIDGKSVWVFFVMLPSFRYNLRYEVLLFFPVNISLIISTEAYMVNKFKHLFPVSV